MAENGKQNGNLTAKQQAFVAAMVLHREVRAAAAACGLSERQCYRYLSLPAVKAALQAESGRLMQEAATAAMTNLQAAVTVLVSIANDNKAPPSSRVAACRALIDAAATLHENYVLSERLDKLEESLCKQ